MPGWNGVACGKIRVGAEGGVGWCVGDGLTEGDLWFWKSFTERGSSRSGSERLSGKRSSVRSVSIAWVVGLLQVWRCVGDEVMGEGEV